MSNFLIFKAAFNNSATPAIGTYTAEGATALFNLNASISPDYYLYNTADNTAVQWFVPTAETTDFEFVADILTRQWSNNVTYFAIADSTGTTRLRLWSKNDNWYFENSDSTATAGDPEYIGVVNPTTSGGFNVFHQFRVRVRKLTASTSSVEVYVDGTLKLTATAGAALVTCAKIGFVGGVNTFGPGTGAGVKNAYVYDLISGDVIGRGVLSEAFNRFINWAKGIFATQDNVVLRSGGSLMTGSRLGRVDDAGVFQVCGGQTGADGGSISLTGKNRGVSNGAVELTAHDSVDSTYVQILPDGTMTVTYPDTTVKNIAMQEDTVPRSGGAVFSGTVLARIDDTSYLAIRGGSGYDQGAQITLYGKDAQGHRGYVYIRASDSVNVSELALRPGSHATISCTSFKPLTGNPTLGDATYRWGQIYSTNSTISTSDSRLKNTITDIDDKLLDAWGNIEPKQYKFNDATETKGEKARYHTGYLAQDIQTECEKQGVDASEYGLFCYDEWEEEPEISDEIETEKDGKKVKEKHIIQPKQEKGNIYALRYEEALVVECKYLRRCIARLTARIEELEKGKEATK